MDILFEVTGFLAGASTCYGYRSLVRKLVKDIHAEPSFIELRKESTFGGIWWPR